MKAAWKGSLILIWMTQLVHKTTGEQSRSEILVKTIQESWTSLAQKLKDVEYTATTWLPGTHPFNYFKYKIIDRALSFPAAINNCKAQGGGLLYGDKDITKYIPNLPDKTEVWYSTKDTMPLLAMKPDDIQYFSENIGTCYTVYKTEPVLTAAAKEVECQQSHKSVCIKMADEHRELYTYRQDIQDLNELAPQIAKEDKATISALLRMLKIGKPAEDLHHPASLEQTIQLLSSIDNSLSDVYTNTPYFPDKATVMASIYSIRNTAHTLLSLVIAQHIENYSRKIDTLIATTITHSSTENEDEEGSQISDENKNYQIALEIQNIQKDITDIKGQNTKIEEQLQNYQENVNKVEEYTKRVETSIGRIDTNQRKLKTAKDNLKALNKRLNNWIQETVNQRANKTEEETEAIQKQNLNSTNTVKLPKVLLDFLQNEEYIWIATSVTILVTLIAIINSIVTCVYAKKAATRNKKMKKHLQINLKQNEEGDVETAFIQKGSRLDKIECRLTKLEKITKILHQQVKQQQTQTQQNSTKKKAPSVPLRPTNMK